MRSSAPRTNASVTSKGCLVNLKPSISITNVWQVGKKIFQSGQKCVLRTRTIRTERLVSVYKPAPLSVGQHWKTLCKVLSILKNLQPSDCLKNHKDSRKNSGGLTLPKKTAVHERKASTAELQARNF